MPISIELKTEAKLIPGCNENDAHTKSSPGDKHGRLIWYLYTMCVVDKQAFVETSSWRHDKRYAIWCLPLEAIFLETPRPHSPTHFHSSIHLAIHQPNDCRTNICLMIWGNAKNAFLLCTGRILRDAQMDFIEAQSCCSLALLSPTCYLAIWCGYMLQVSLPEWLRGWT